ncbi:MAG: hypothetical protein ACI4DT_04100 [Chordicoccus sp.]
MKKILFCLLAVTVMCCGCGTSDKSTAGTATKISSEQTGTESVSSDTTANALDPAESSESITESELEKEEYAGSTEIVLSDNETGGFQ